MSAVLLEYKGAILAVFIIITYFMWMDVALYYHIQAMQTVMPVNANGGKVHPRLFSPFNGLTIKMMMIDHANHYIHTPAATLFNQITHFSDVMYFITPNMISAFHILVAVISARFISSEALLMRQVGVLLFEFRSFLDCLDGVVYRSRAHQQSNISNFGSIGYIVDGVADTLGSMALIVACYLYLRRNLPRKGLYLPLSVWSKLSSSNCDDGGLKTTNSNGILTHRRVMGVLACFGLQLTISAFFWDRYISGYHDLLENTQASEQQTILQIEVMKSALMWIIMWFWRIFNAHALLEMVLFCIFFDKLWEFLVSIQYIGFIALFILISLTEVHYHDVSNYIGKLAATTATRIV